MPIPDDDGQATVEHIGLVAVIALVLLSAGAVAAFAGPTLFNRVSSGFQKALCTITGEACVTLARQPCPTLRTAKTKSQGVSLGLVSIGHNSTLLIERRSDGTYVMSLTEGATGGEKAVVAEDSPDVQAEAEASFAAGLSAGRTYSAATPEEAYALVDRLRHQSLPAVRSVLAGVADLAGLYHADPSVTAYQFAGDGAVSALAKFGLKDLFATAVDANLSAQLGVRVAAHERQVTAFVNLSGQAGAFFDALPGVTARFTRTRNGQVERAKSSVTNPLSMNADALVVGGGSLAVQIGPGPTIQQLELTGYLGAAAGTGGGANGMRQEIHVRLDPSDPAVRDALAGVLHSPLSSASYAGLARAAGTSAAIDRRTFVTTDTLGSHDHSASLSIPGLDIGGHIGSRTTTQRLVDEESLPVGGVWERRLDCVAGG